MRSVDRRIGGSIAALALLVAGCRRSAQAARTDQVAAAQATDAVAFAIMAHRHTYSQVVVERLATAGIVASAPDYDGEKKKLPLPVQFLRLAGEHVARSPQADKLRFRLLSAWAINKDNLPRNDFEREALVLLSKKPDEPVRRSFEEKGRRQFVSMYADRAVGIGCVECHNAHPGSPRHDYKLNDVMGALLVSIAIEE